MTSPTSSNPRVHGGWDAPPSGRSGHAGAPGGSRLRGSREVRAVLQEGRRRSGERVILYVRPAEQGPRAAFVCGRRVGGAVVRNRARRLMREAWRSLAPRVREGYDVVFVARTSVRKATVRDLVDEMAGLLRACGVVAR